MTWLSLQSYQTRSTLCSTRWSWSIWCMVPTRCLIHIVHARWAAVHARTVTRAHSVSQRHRERIHTPSIGSTMMAIQKKIQGHYLDNQWVVPYNPCLQCTFNYHINIEACGSIKSVKYLFKHIYKGHDRALVVMTKQTTKGTLMRSSSIETPGGWYLLKHYGGYMALTWARTIH
jgi:hypothetical protein